MKLQNCHGNGFKMASRFKKVSKEEVNTFKTHLFKYCAGKKQLSHYSFSILTITGHRQEHSVEAYDSGNEDEQRQLSNIIHSLTAKKSRLESEQVEFPFSLSTSSPVPQLVVAKFTISITLMWLSTKDRLME